MTPEYRCGYIYRRVNKYSVAKLVVIQCCWIRHLCAILACWPYRAEKNDYFELSLIGGPQGLDLKKFKFYVI